MPVFAAPIFQYLNAWLLMAFVVAAAVASEKVYFAALFSLRRRMGHDAPAPARFAQWFRTPVTLPGRARPGAALYFPALAFGALLTVCACLPVCTYIPVIDNGADIVQVVHFMLISEVFVLISLYAAGTSEALEIAGGEMRAMIRFMMPFMALCASVADYLIKNGLDSDPFSFNSFSLFGQMRSMSWLGLSGIALLAAAVLSQLPQRSADSGTLFFSACDMKDYDGAPRGILQIWSVLRSFIVIAVVVYIVFPGDIIGTFGDFAAIAWSGQAASFIFFWTVVGVARVCVAPLCRLAMGSVEKCLPFSARLFAMYALTVAGMLLLWYEGVLLSMEAAAF